MRTFYLSKREAIGDLKRQSTRLHSSKILRSYAVAPGKIEPTQFNQLENIQYLYYDSQTALSTLWDMLMHKESFNSDKLLDAHKTMEEYLEYNKRVATQLLTELDAHSTDLVIVNDSNLLLLPLLVPCHVAIRNLSFDSFFIHRIPYYQSLIKALMHKRTQIFFKHKRDMENYRAYIHQSREHTHTFNSNWIEESVDTERILRVMKENNSTDQSTDNLNSTDYTDQSTDKLNSTDHTDNHTNSYGNILVDTSMLLDVEPFLINNPSISLFISRIHVDFNTDTDRLIQYYQKMYPLSSIRVLVSLDDIISCMNQQNILYIGREHTQYANFMRIDQHTCEYDSTTHKLVPVTLQPPPAHPPLTEMEYLRIFLELNGCVLRLTEEQRRHILEKEEETLKGIRNNRNTRDSTRDINTSDIINTRDINTRDISDNISDNNWDLHSLLSSYALSTQRQNVRRMHIAEKLSSSVISNMRPIRKCLVDYDGTLMELHPHPSDAVPTSELVDFLLEYSDRITICTGRSMGVVEEWFPVGIEVYAEHGALFRNKRGEWEVCEYVQAPIRIEDILDNTKDRGTNTKGTIRDSTIDINTRDNRDTDNTRDTKENISGTSAIHQNVVDILLYYRNRIPYSTLESKSCGYAFHYRQSLEYLTATQNSHSSLSCVIDHLYRDLAKVSGVYDFILTTGKQVIEVKLAGKGDVARVVQPDLVAGDDVTDEDMFLNSPVGCYTIKIGRDKTRADFYVSNVKEFMELFKEILEGKEREEKRYRIERK